VIDTRIGMLALIRFSEEIKVLIAPGITIRLFAVDDAVAIADLFQASVRTPAARNYTPSQLRAWAPGSIDADKVGERCLNS
jgi:hypothetical protein